MARRYHSVTDLPRSLPLFPLTGAVLLPRGQLPLNVFEPRYLEMVNYALQGDRLIGMIQPTESEDANLRPPLSQVGCAGRITAFRETEDNRYFITLDGICRFRLTGEMDTSTAWRAGYCDFAAFAPDLIELPEPQFSRDKLLSSLRAYLTSNDLQADWKSVMSAPGEALVNALVMMCPFDPAEKQALLEAPTFDERLTTLMALLEMSAGESGPVILN